MFREGHSTFRRSQSSLQLPGGASGCCANNVTIIRLQVTVLLTYNLWTNGFFLGGGLRLFEIYFKNEAATSNITGYRYRMAYLIGYIWSKVASVGVGLSAFD